MTIKSNNQKRGATAPVLLAALAVAPLLFTTSCLSKRDRKTIEINPTPVGESAQPDAAGATRTAVPVNGGIAPIMTDAPTTPAVPSPPPYSLEDAIKYEVQPGDALSTIAAKHGASLADVKAANKIQDINKIRAGDTILLPNKDAAAAVETAAEAVTTGAEAATTGAETPATGTTPPFGVEGGGGGLTLPSE